MPPRHKRERLASSIGAPSEDDSPTAHLRNTSSASSYRRLPATTVPALTTLCARVFVANVPKLGADASTWQRMQRWLKILPDNLVPKLFAMLRASCPTLLSQAMIAAYFLRGPSITLTSELPGVKRSTIPVIGLAGSTVRELVLDGFDKYQDDLFAALLPKLPSLRVLVLRGCAKVGPKTVKAAATSCPELVTVNLNYTAVTPVSLVPLVTLCKNLAVLKVAGVPNWSDATLTKFFSSVTSDTNFRLPNLRKLKLQRNPLTIVSVNSFLSLMPHLTSLDISFTNIRHRPLCASPPPIEKLVLTSTAISITDLMAVVASLPGLKTLAIGAMGGTTPSLGSSKFLELTEVLETLQHLEDISLVNNSHLGYAPKRRAIATFIQKVGRRCKRLNLSAIPGLCSSDLSTLLSEDPSDPAPRLEILRLNGTGVADDAVHYISACVHLQTLDVAGTKLTSNGLFHIIDACQMLETLDLTSCRGVRIGDRRRFFEVWANERESR